MSEKHDLKSISLLSDDELLRRVFDLVAQSRRIEWVLVAHIAEVDARRLFAEKASPSMIRYCMDVLHLSEGAAFRRITAARKTREFPVLLEMLEDGRIHLCGIAVLSKCLTPANHEEALARATHKSKREVEILAREFDPKPDVAPSIRKRPQRKATTATTPPTSSEVLSPGRVEPDGQEAMASKLAPAKKPAKVEPLAPARYKVEFTASEELRGKLKRLAKLMPGRDLAAVIDAAVSEKLERVEAKRFGKTNKPRKNVEDADTSPRVRGISAPIKRHVCARDGNQCTFFSSEGRRCPERDNLEFHHNDPYGLGGDRSADNIRLLCRTHNAYMAERDYGKKKMDQFRRSA